MTTPIVAWTMTRMRTDPVYTFGVLDDLLLLAWESPERPDAEAGVYRLQNPENAHRSALNRVKLRERSGYALSIHPRLYAIPDSIARDLRRRVGTRTDEEAALVRNVLRITLRKGDMA